MTLTIFARFHAATGNAETLIAAIREVVQLTREEPGCISIDSYRSTLDMHLFHLHSRWTDVTAFERHSSLTHTVNFIEKVDALVDQPRDVSRAFPLDHFGVEENPITDIKVMMGG